MDVNFSEVLPDARVLELISNSYYEVKDYVDYLTKLLSAATDSSDREILKIIRLNEEKHAKLLYGIYKTIGSGEMEKKESAPGISLDGRTIIEEYEKCIFYSLDAADHFRRIYFSFLNVEIRDKIYEIISDEENHGVKFTYLYAKYR